MSRLTVRIPDSLRRQSEAMARDEGVSINQYVVYALTRQLTPAYTCRVTPEAEIAEQRAQYGALRARLGTASPEAVQEALDAREVVEPDPDLDPGDVARLRDAIARRRHAEVVASTASGGGG